MTDSNLSDGKKTAQPSRGVLSRRTFLQAATGTVLLAHADQDATPPQNTREPKPLSVPNTTADDLKPRFATALTEMEQAIDAAANDAHRMYRQYGIRNLLQFQRGVTLSITPSCGNQPARFTAHLNATPNRVERLDGFARLVDACCAMEKLYWEHNRRHPKEPPQNVNYITVTQQIIRSYNRQHPKEEMPETLEHSFSSLLVRAMRDVSLCSESRLPAAQQQLDNQAFSDLFYTSSNYTIEPHSTAQRMPRQLALSRQFLYQGDIPASHALVTPTYVPLPDKATLDRLDKLDTNFVSPGQKHLLTIARWMLDHHEQPNLYSNFGYTFADPLGIASINTNVTIHVTNPHARARQTAQRADTPPGR